LADLWGILGFKTNNFGIVLGLLSTRKWLIDRQNGAFEAANGDIDMAWYRSLLVTSILSFGFMGTLIALDENPSLRQPIEKN
jgi:hypothetical protein